MTMIDEANNITVAPRSQAIVLALNGVAPRIAPDVFLAPGAVIVGDVEIGPGCSVWFNAVIRGDKAPIRIGARTNIQDGAILHIDVDRPCIVGNDVTIAHRAIVHGTTVGDGVMIGMGAIVLSYSQIGNQAVIAAGAVVTEGAIVRERALMMGMPAREKLILPDERLERFTTLAESYVRNGAHFRDTLVELDPNQRTGGV